MQKKEIINLLLKGSQVMLVLAEIMIQGQIDPRSVNAIKRNNNFIDRKK